MSKFTLMSCLLIHFQMFIANWWMLLNMQDKWPILFTAIRGVLYLLYPFCGIVSQAYMGYFKVINASLVLFAASSFTMILLSIINLWSFDEKFEDEYIYITVTLVVVIQITSLIALALYESNAIQFGMDQLVEASSQQLSSFLRWYFWCAHIGPTLMIYLVMGVIVWSSNCTIRDFYYGSLHTLFLILLISSCIQLPLSVIGIVACIYYKCNFRIERASSNPLRLIYDVLKYTSIPRDAVQ